MKAAKQLHGLRNTQKGRPESNIRFAMLGGIAPLFLPRALHSCANGAPCPAAPAARRAGSRRGFISFVLAAAFLFALIPAASVVSSSQPDYSYENFRAMLVGEVALKQAFYQSSAQAISIACLDEKMKQAEALAAGGYYTVSEGEIARKALANAESFESSLRQLGYDAVFWCGFSDEFSRKAASAEMMGQKRAIRPESASELSSDAALCKNSFMIDLNSNKFSASSLGFSIYGRGQGMGKAAVFPDSYEVGFTC